MSLRAQLEEIARSRPGHPALSSGVERLTYTELLTAIDRRAAELEEGLPVLLDGGEPTRFVIDFFAARERGLPAIAHPPATPRALREIRERELRRCPPQRLGDATVFFSSGSVGPAKAVPLSDANLAAAALAFASWNDVGARDRLAIGLSPAQIFGFVRGVLNAILLGAEAIFFVPRRDPLAEAELLGATVVLLPSALVSLAARHAGRVRLSALRCGGGLLSETDADAVESIRGVPVRSGYGLTESSGLASRQPGDRPRRRGSSGRIAPGVDVSIVADDGSECAPGEPGEIRLRGASVFSGYLSPEDPDPFDALGRLRSGDTGFVDGSGELCVRGRLAFALRSGDRILCAEEVEAAIAEHPGVAEVAAAPLDRAFGVLVVLHDASEALLEEIRAHAQSRLPGFARPRRVLRVPAIPRTPAGKVDRLAASEWLSRTLSRA
jgi:acyl-CoA synthetase (AMP-forming)/AMP-acid ligase II